MQEPNTENGRALFNRLTRLKRRRYINSLIEKIRVVIGIFAFDLKNHVYDIFLIRFGGIIILSAAIYFALTTDVISYLTTLYAVIEGIFQEFDAQYQ